jgi:hypothetical protein
VGGRWIADGTAPDATVSAWLTVSAEGSRRRGNLVRAALRAERAARAAPADEQARTRAAAARDLDRLADRLRRALDLPVGEAAVWRRVLGALLGPAADGRWTTEGRLLYDLQQVCLDHEREVYAVDLVEWAVTWFRRPLRRHLPHQRLVLVVKHLRRAVGRLPAVRLPAELRGPLHDLLHAAVLHGEERIRDRFRPAARAALDGVGLLARNRASAVERDRLVEELLDRVVERDLLTMSDVRDAVARSRVKLHDLHGADEFLLGDPLIRANRALAWHLDGVYHRGEIYLRWLQRLSSAAFGTRAGRFLTRYVALPFGGAFFLLEGFKAVLHELPGRQPQHTHDTTWLAGHLSREVLPTLLLGVFLFGVLHVPPFRHGLIAALADAWRGARVVFFDLPAAALRLPVVRQLVQSRLCLLLYLFALKPLAWATLATGSIRLAGGTPRLAYATGVAVFLVTGLVLNSPVGSRIEEVLADGMLRVWRLLRRDLLPGLYYLVVGVFRALTERVERLLYAVDEWLRFRAGDSQLSAIAKPILGLGWFAVAYAVRAVINLFVEPTFNPIKHFPVVTVAAKLLFPFIPALAPAIAAAVSPVLGVWLAGGVAAAALFFIPGFAGFLVWELKENWRLYAANQPDTLRPAVVGSHGETVRRLLRPGFHSGTVPKIFAKLRRASGKSARKQEEALHHVAAAVTRFVERDLLAVLDCSPRWGDTLRLRLGGVALGTRRIRIELCCRDVAGPPLSLDIDEGGGYLLAGVRQTGWLDRTTECQREALADALAGFYHLAGVDLVREEVEALLPPGASYGPCEAVLLVWPASGAGEETVVPLKPGTGHEPSDVPPLAGADELLFSARPVRWADWVAAWENVTGTHRDGLVTADSVLPPVTVAPRPAPERFPARRPS